MQLPGIFITMKELARIFGISRSSMYNYLKECGIELDGKLISPSKQLEILEAINRRAGLRYQSAGFGRLAEAPRTESDGQ